MNRCEFLTYYVWVEDGICRRSYPSVPIRYLRKRATVKTTSFLEKVEGGY
ncbi:MAG: hypothetical protein QNK27_06180 [Desulfuromusa sp.]|nr:hypothetical protein [Desulfuromusa sp.]